MNSGNRKRWAENRDLSTYLNEVDLSKVVQASRLEKVENADDVFVLKVSKQLDLAKGAKAKHAMVEWSDFLDRDFSLGGKMNGRPKGNKQVSERVKNQRNILTLRHHTRPPL
jgi:hypothetical protein